jgi:hypothetical protein
MSHAWKISSKLRPPLPCLPECVAENYLKTEQ